MLDVTNTRRSIAYEKGADYAFQPPRSVDTTPAAFRARDLPEESPQTSLHDLVRTIVALKSNANIHVKDQLAPFSSSTFMNPRPASVEPGRTVSSSSSVISSKSSQSITQDDNAPHQFSEVIASLQREAMLLRVELNMETWLSSENIKHISRLYADRILSNNVENERQSLVCHLA
jgi:hypothetical protein